MPSTTVDLAVEVVVVRVHVHALVLAADRPVAFRKILMLFPLVGDNKIRQHDKHLEYYS